jgi:predicted Ser/Thr protein kinase
LPKYLSKLLQKKQGKKQYTINEELNITGIGVVFSAEPGSKYPSIFIARQDKPVKSGK